jgi:hypothetical protein
MYDEIKAGRMNADGVNKAYDDYYAARKEYEESYSYKLTMLAVAPLLVLGAAAGGMPYCGYRGYGYRGYHGYGGKTILTTTPIGGGAYQTVIKGYR